MKKTVGVLGGMGPEATAYFFRLIISRTKAEKDQEHIPVLIHSNPRVPPRTDAILKKGKSPLPLLLKGARSLERAGADFLVMPCVTAHYFYPQIATKVHIPFLNILEETLLYVRKKLPGLKKIGLISSSGTLKSGLFHQVFNRAGVEVITPLEKDQLRVMEAIFGEKGIKAGFTSGTSRRTILRAAEKLVRRGAEAVIAGCTEIPLVLSAEDLPVPLVEPLEILALASIVKAGYSPRDKG